MNFVQFNYPYNTKEFPYLELISMKSESLVLDLLHSFSCRAFTATVVVTTLRFGILRLLSKGHHILLSKTS